MALNKLKCSYIFIYLVSLLSLNKIYHIDRIYNLFFLNLLGINWDFDPLTKTLILCLIYTLIFLLGYFLLFSKRTEKITVNKYFPYALVILLLGLSIIFTLLGNNQIIDFNSDNDEALELWINSLWNGQFPYENLTPLENYISVFPFLPLYSIVFYLMGNVGWQNIINLLIIFYVIFKLSKTKQQLNFALISLLISVPFYIFLFAQSDHITVAAFALLGAYLLYQKRISWGSLIFALLIASKAYIWLFIPTTLYYIYRNKQVDFKKSLLIYILIPVILFIPFILWNPLYFFTVAPIGVDSAHLSYFPFSEFIISLVIMGISLFSYKKSDNLFISFFITFFISSFLLFSRTMFILILTIIMLGISFDNLFKGDEYQ